MSDSAGGAPGQGGAEVKGLRLVSMKRGKDGYGFHMYTNKDRDSGQYIKSVTANSPADLAGMLPGDHILAVDGSDVTGENHHQVVERVRKGHGEKKLLIIDTETEDEMKKNGEEINPDDAIEMISREPPPPKMEDDDKPELDLPSLNDMKRFGAGTRKKDARATKSWKESVEAYNNL